MIKLIFIPPFYAVMMVVYRTIHTLKYIFCVFASFNYICQNKSSSNIIKLELHILYFYPIHFISVCPNLI